MPPQTEITSEYGSIQLANGKAAAGGGGDDEGGERRPLVADDGGGGRWRGMPATAAASIRKRAAIPRKFTAVVACGGALLAALVTAVALFRGSGEGGSSSLRWNSGRRGADALMGAPDKGLGLQGVHREEQSDASPSPIWGAKALDGPLPTNSWYLVSWCSAESPK